MSSSSLSSLLQNLEKEPPKTFTITNPKIDKLLSKFKLATLLPNELGDIFQLLSRSKIKMASASATGPSASATGAKTGATASGPGASATGPGAKAIGTSASVTGTSVTGTSVTGTSVTGTSVTGASVTGTSVTGTSVTGATAIRDKLIADFLALTDENKFLQLRLTPIKTAINTKNIKARASSMSEEWQKIRNAVNKATEGFYAAYPDKKDDDISRFNLIGSVTQNIKNIQRQNGERATNAFLKQYEMLKQLKLIDCATAAPAKVFFNCELPGNFYLATRNFLKEHTNCKDKKFDWLANSLYSTNVSVLSDTYGILKNNQANWLINAATSKEGDGDTTDPAKIKDIATKIRAKMGDGATLYTSDAGIEKLTQAQYAFEEENTARLNFGQVLVGLMTLAEGGHLVVKMFTFCTPFMRSLIILVTALFKETSIVKPETSRPGNSEIYLVGKGFLKSQFTPELEEILLSFLKVPAAADKYFSDEIGNFMKIATYYMENNDELKTLAEFLFVKRQSTFIHLVHAMKDNRITLDDPAIRDERDKVIKQWLAYYYVDDVKEKQTLIDLKSIKTPVLDRLFAYFTTHVFVPTPSSAKRRREDEDGDSPKRVHMTQDTYYLNSQRNFLEMTNQTFVQKFPQTVASKLTCATKDRADFSLMAHQHVVKEYLGTYTPYRGLLVYHGLGSGKTCTSIAIAEGLQRDKQVVVMTPSALEVNFKDEIKKCGDVTMNLMTNHWVNLSKEELQKPEHKTLLALYNDFFAKSSKKEKPDGYWYASATSTGTVTTNYSTLSEKAKRSLERQIDFMIEQKYKFLHYNASTTFFKDISKTLGKLSPFNDKVVIIDEAHRFVQLITNKLNDGNSEWVNIYKQLMAAENCKLVFLSGTPIVNHDNELAVLFNMLRGYITTFTFKLKSDAPRKEKDYKDKLTQQGSIIDYVAYTAENHTLTVTRNPFHFVRNNSHPHAVNYDDTHNDKIDVVKYVQESIPVNGKPIVEQNMALPDKADEFNEQFITPILDGDLTVKILFQQRILGLTSYFPGEEKLMPKLKPLRIEEIEMSNWQFKLYNEGRRKEILKVATAARQNDEDSKPGAYRSFSRALCNFAFPHDILKPGTAESTSTESTSTESTAEVEEEGEAEKETLIKAALQRLSANKQYLKIDDGLNMYSPKFVKIVQKLQGLKGLHLVYSSYKVLEGLGILNLVLENNGFTEFQPKKKSDGTWSVVDEKALAQNTQLFIIYDIPSEDDIKKVKLDIFNGNLTAYPAIADLLKKKKCQIKVFMITASGSDGISLKNVQHVHIVEPYWHPSRLEQCIGRARRICSHESLPKAEQTVEVYLYLMKFSAEQLRDPTFAANIRANDKSKWQTAETTVLDTYFTKPTITSEVFTTDEYLYYITYMKARSQAAILNVIKETAIDCQSLPSSKKKCFTDAMNNAIPYKPKLVNTKDIQMQVVLLAKTKTQKRPASPSKNKTKKIRIKENEENEENEEREILALQRENKIQNLKDTIEYFESIKDEKSTNIAKAELAAFIKGVPFVNQYGEEPKKKASLSLSLFDDE